MFQDFLTTIKSWISDPLKINEINISMGESLVTNLTHSFLVSPNRSALWALINSSNEIIGVYTPVEVELNFVRVLSKNKLYTDGSEIFLVMEL